MDKVAIVRGAAVKLTEAELAIDMAIAKTCQLIDGLMTARGELRLSTTLGGESGERLAAALSALMQARRETAAAHGELAEVQLRLGVRRTSLDGDGDPGGPLDKPPPRTGRLGEVVEEESARVRPLRRA